MAKAMKVLVVTTLQYPSEELKQEAIDAFCKDDGYLNLISEGTIPETTTKEEFFNSRVGSFIMKKIEAVRVRNEKAQANQAARQASQKASEVVKNSLKDLQIK